MESLRATINEYRQVGKAIGHFNFSDSNQLMAIARAAKETGLPVIAGLSEGERDFFPIRHARALVDLYRSQGIGIFLNADHTYSVEKVEQAIAGGVDSVVVDGAKLPFDENAGLLTACVTYARAAGRDVVMEGELGYIGQSSKILTELPPDAAITPEMMTSVTDAKRFIEATGIDCLAPAVGNIHGMVGVAKDPALNPGRVRDIAAAVGIPLVLHGASGNTEEDIKACIKEGVAVVHINTELRVRYRDSLRETLKGDETTPYKFLTPSVEAMQKFLIEKMRLFAGQ